jgi:hypothetical protein
VSQLKLSSLGEFGSCERLEEPLDDGADGVIVVLAGSRLLAGERYTCHGKRPSSRIEMADGKGPDTVGEFALGRLESRFPLYKDAILPKLRPIDC